MCNTTSLASTGRTLGPLARSDHHPGTRDTRPAGTPPSTTGPCGGYVKVTVTFSPDPRNQVLPRSRYKSRAPALRRALLLPRDPGRPVGRPVGQVGPARAGLGLLRPQVRSRRTHVALCVPRARTPWRRNRTGPSPRFAWPSSARPPTSFLAMFITLALGQRGHVGKAPAVASALTSLSGACSRPCAALPCLGGLPGNQGRWGPRLVECGTAGAKRGPHSSVVLDPVPITHTGI